MRGQDILARKTINKAFDLPEIRKALKQGNGKAQTKLGPRRLGRKRLQAKGIQADGKRQKNTKSGLRIKRHRKTGGTGVLAVKTLETKRSKN